MPKIQLSKGYSSWGAQMGRDDQIVSGRCHLQRMPLDKGGYDSGGAYWGTGKGILPMYVCQDSEGNQFFIRARHRTDAKNWIRGFNGESVTFYN